MQQRLPAAPSPLARLLSAAVLLAVFLISIALGAVLFLAVLSLAAVLGVALYLRLRWLRRKSRQQSSPSRRDGDVLEGEYTVKDEKPPRRH